MDTKAGLIDTLRNVFNRTREKGLILSPVATTLGGLSSVFNLMSGNVVGLATDVLFATGFGGLWKSELQDSPFGKEKWQAVGYGLLSSSFLIAATAAASPFSIALNLGIAALTAGGAYFSHQKMKEMSTEAEAAPKENISAPAPQPKGPEV